ncbi:MAG TPA: FGGY-family carbohydrate kinase, partial [Aggregatilineales bacterium]|nr:FGGY-family carbohydrate kinase [Aggregatilineales bacterium]
ARIRRYCQAAGQPVPESVGSLVRCILESLALKYRYVLEQIVAVRGRPVKTIHIIGGGSQNSLLCQMTADATGCTVVGGPAEASSIGNAIVQLVALGDLGSMAEGRQLVRDSFPLAVYQPAAQFDWDAAAVRFKRLLDNPAEL